MKSHTRAQTDEGLVVGLNTVRVNFPLCKLAPTKVGRQKQLSLAGLCDRGSGSVRKTLRWALKSRAHLECVVFLCISVHAVPIYW